MRAKLVNEAIKHLQPRDKADVIKDLKKSSNYPHYILYKAMLNDLDDLVDELLKNYKPFSLPGQKPKDLEEDAFYTIASLYLTNEEISFNYSGRWRFDEKGEIYCETYDGEHDLLCEQFVEFLHTHNIKVTKIRKFSNNINTYVNFSGNASDIIKLILNFIITDEASPYDIIEQAYDIIFTG